MLTCLLGRREAPGDDREDDEGLDIWIGTASILGVDQRCACAVDELRTTPRASYRYCIAVLRCDKLVRASEVKWKLLLRRFTAAARARWCELRLW